MNRLFFTAAVLLGVGAALPGCVTLCSKREVIRADEPRRPVTFESPAVAAEFAKATKLDTAKQVGRTDTIVPFGTLQLTEQFLGENAKFNDAVVKCDNNQDGVITAQEVDAFARLD